ncbi:MAG: heavy metal translocating P-type ATPase metal-binding domain-containing protein [Lewinellaceae bacterium]|nr:heavy metal translocating P-type ATPase metal-binding domain-containing protein [Lewinellaceae bacterium]
MITETSHHTRIACKHCGDNCPSEHPIEEDLHFCCHGCQIVYHVLKDNGLGDYYTYETAPGISQKSINKKNYAFLDDEDVIESLLEFKEDQLAKISFSLPQIHCASCIWLLENIQKLHSGIKGSRVNFLRKTATISYNPQHISLRQLVEQLALIGYPPELNLQKLSNAKSTFVDRSLYYKLGLAGFSFGNIMLLSFPEYLGFSQANVSFYIGYINIILAIPVLFYSGFDYLRSAWWTVKLKQINIDIPIAIGMLTLFFRSVYEILSGSGEGYLDSLTGFIFFLLIGKWFQSYTFYSIAFDRNYKSYFPISTLVKMGEEYVSRTLDKLKEGDILLLKNEEIIPGDGLLLKGSATIDYSFVTGEADPISKEAGEKVFAGGKLVGANAIIQLIKPVDQSYLTKLWDEDSFSIDKEAKTQTLIQQVGKYFTITVLVVAFLTFLYWLVVDDSKAFNAFTAVLIVACPCALALAVPFSYGNIIRILGKHGFYLKNVQVIERFQQVKQIIFDKTGTLTDHSKISVFSHENAVSPDVVHIVKSATFQSNHPISKAIFETLPGDYTTEITYFKEYVGAGFEAKVGSHLIKVGSEKFVLGSSNNNGSTVIVLMDGKQIMTFDVTHTLRENVMELMVALSQNYRLAVLSGDNEKDKLRLTQLLPEVSDFTFNQSPQDKLEYIRNLQKKDNKIAMIGDGLNDAGALMQSDVGIVISENSNNFTPACDAIISAKTFGNLKGYLNYLSKSRWIIIGAFVMAFFYNVIGLYFAVRGQLSPVVAAILMPISSISVMFYGLITTSLMFRYVSKK